MAPSRGPSLSHAGQCWGRDPAKSAQVATPTALLPGRPFLNPADAELFAQLGQKAPQPRDAIVACFATDEADMSAFSQVRSPVARADASEAGRAGASSLAAGDPPARRRSASASL